VAVGGYGQSDARAYRDDVASMPDEPSLANRLENLLASLNNTLSTLAELSQGPRPEKNGVPPAVAGVLQLGVECERAAQAVQDQVDKVAARIGRL
jgi:hypothetical protein